MCHGDIVCELSTSTVDIVLLLNSARSE